MHLDDNTHECSSLRNCASILRFPVAVEPTFIADTDGAAVEGATVSAHLIQSAVLSDRAILADVEVISDINKTTLQMIVFQLLWSIITVLARGRAVNNDIADGVRTHKHTMFHVSEEFVLGGDLVATDGKRECFLDHRLLRLRMLIQCYSLAVLQS